MPCVYFASMTPLVILLAHCAACASACYGSFDSFGNACQNNMATPAPVPLQSENATASAITRFVLLGIACLLGAGLVAGLTPETLCSKFHSSPVEKEVPQQSTLSAVELTAVVAAPQADV